jgi:hypothetical protein
MSDSMSNEREPPNKLLQNSLEELNTITASTVTAHYHGGGVFILQARDNEFWSDTFQSLRECDFQGQKQLDGELYVEKQPHDERACER